jgi:hypothetical protein
MKTGDLITCRSNTGYSQLTKGKQYRVEVYDPKTRTENFTWPAYVTVLGDDGNPLCCHAHRFEEYVEDGP